MLVYVQSIIAIGIGIISAITDFKERKIYNKYLISAIAISVIAYIVFWKQIEIDLIFRYTLNLLISVGISFAFFYFKIWAAGDAKLFLALIFMIPYEIYGTNEFNVFPALYLLIMIFGMAFVYIVIETVYLWIKDKEKFEILKIFNITKEQFGNFLIRYFMGYVIILFINNIITRFFSEFRLYNGGLALLCNMLILLFIYRIVGQIKLTSIITTIFVVLNLIYYIKFGFCINVIDIKLLVLVIIIMLFRTIAEKYNYEEIKIENLKPRMILAYGSVLKFYSSRIKGLPKITDETTDSRLTEEEVNSIKRWSKTKKGQNTIEIVRHIPFAPFMMLGEILFWILKLYIYR